MVVQQVERSGLGANPEIIVADATLSSKAHSLRRLEVCISAQLGNCGELWFLPEISANRPTYAVRPDISVR